MRRVVVIANPHAGRGRGRAARDAAVSRLRELGLTPVVHTGSSPSDTRRLAADAVRARPDVLVIVGGDGTLAGVVDLLAGTGIPVVLVPAGTGNDLARALDIPFGSTEAAAGAVMAAAHGIPHPLDVGEAVCPDGAATFLTVAALGFDAKVSERTNRLRWPKGRARYFLALAVELIRFRPMRFAVRADGAPLRLDAGTLIAVGNTRSYGGGMPVCPDADPHDGLLDATLVAPLGRLQLLLLFPHLLRGTHLALPQARSVRARTVEVSAPDLVVYADGERVGTGSVRLRVRRGALTVLLPEVVA